MLRLVYSNRTEELLAELAVRVRGQQATDGPLVPVRVVVPNTTVEAYVRLGIAREQGIAANLDAPLLTRFADEEAAPEGARVADARSLEAMALTLLLDDALVAESVLAPVRAYIHSGDVDAAARDVRRVQLAARIGRVFEEYTYSRADLLGAWQRGVLALGERDAETERWQRRLWLAMFGDGGIAHARSPRVVPLHDAVAALGPCPGAAVHVFGFAHMARSFHALVARIASAREVVVYTLSPCEGFWEDVDRADPAPLHLWGRPGRENVRALNAIAGFDHEDRFVDPLDGKTSQPTLLHELQRDVLRREPAREAPDDPPDLRITFEGDVSVVVLEHASIRRECEAVASGVWQALRDDPALRFDDIAVVVPPGDAAVYGAHLSATFREAHDIPFQRVGLPAALPSPEAEAIEMLLAFPLGTFTRPELLRLAVHPAVVASIGRVDPDQWVAWCSALGVVHGADHADHDGTYIDRDILNWDQAIRRLALGVFMTGDATGDAAPFCMGDDAYVPHEVPGSELDAAASFGTLVRSLIADARYAREARLTMPEWAEFLRAMIESYVAPTSEAEADELSRRLRQVHSLGEVDLGGHRVGYRVACELARERLAAGGGSRGGEGVFVSTLAALRGLPRRVVFACGMGEGRFPAVDALDPLDLRAAERREGDVTARERDRFAFLELLIGVRDKLVLSYVSRDALTGDSLSPSLVVDELLHAIDRGYVSSKGLRRRHPLRRWDPRYFPEVFHTEPSEIGTLALPEARAEAQTLAMRRDAERHAVPRAAEVVARAEGGDPAWQALASHLRLAPLPPATARTEARVIVPMYALVKLLELPLQGWARFRLGLDEIETDDVLALECEPFETDRRDETLLLRDVLLDAAERGQPLDRAYDAVVRNRELRGWGPSGVFARGERAEHLQTLTTWREQLESNEVPLESLQVYRFGRAGERSRAHSVHDALVVDVDVVDGAGVMRVLKVEIAGRTLPVGGGARASVLLSKRAKEGTDEWSRAGLDRSLLRAFVDYAVLTASGVEAGDGHVSMAVVATREGPVVSRAAFPPLTADAARSWVRDVVRDLLGGPHAYFMPCEAVFVHHARGPRGPVVPIIEEARDKLRGGDGPPALRSAYGPVPRPQEYPAPDEATARGMIARRFGILLSALRSER